MALVQLRYEDLAALRLVVVLSYESLLDVVNSSNFSPGPPRNSILLQVPKH